MQVRVDNDLRPENVDVEDAPGGLKIRIRQRKFFGLWETSAEANIVEADAIWLYQAMHKRLVSALEPSWGPNVPAAMALLCTILDQNKQIDETTLRAVRRAHSFLDRGQDLPGETTDA